MDLEEQFETLVQWGRCACTDSASAEDLRAYAEERIHERIGFDYGDEFRWRIVRVGVVDTTMVVVVPIDPWIITRRA